MRAVRRREVRVQTAQTFPEFHRGATIFFLTVFHFDSRFRQMRVNLVIFFVGKFYEFCGFLLTHRINGVRHHHNLHTFRFALVLSHEVYISRPALRSQQIFGHGNANSRTDSHIFDSLYSLFAMPIHVRKENRSRLDHFENRQAAPYANIIIRKLSFGGPNIIIQPLVKFHIVSKTAQQRHCRMRVAVIERRHNCKMRAINNFSVFVIIRF